MDDELKKRVSDEVRVRAPWFGFVINGKKMPNGHKEGQWLCTYCLYLFAVKKGVEAFHSELIN